MSAKKELLAAYWTLAGDVYPCAANEISPFPLRDRCEAAMRAGWSGVGLILDDLEYSIEKYGLSGVKKILEDTGMKYFELEILMDWYFDGEARAKSDQLPSPLHRTGRRTRHAQSENRCEPVRQKSGRLPPHDRRIREALPGRGDGWRDGRNRVHAVLSASETSQTR